MSVKKTVYFHIGTHKTGSTALQKFFVENSCLLLDKGFSYADYHNIEMNQGYLVNPERWNDVSYSEKVNHIISGEDFYKKILDIKEVVKDKLEAFNIQFIVYFKRQDLMKQSVYNQIVKMHGYYKSIEEDNHYDLDYYRFLKDLEAAYPNAGIKVRVYEKEQFERGSIYADFLSVLDLEITDDFKIPEGVVNPSLTRDKLEFCRYINMLGLPVGLRTQINRSVVKAALDSNEAQLFRSQDLLSPTAALEIMDRYKEGNENIANEYLGRKDRNLFYDAFPNISDEWQSYPGLSEALVIEIIKEIDKIAPGVLNKMVEFLKNNTPNSHEAKVAFEFIMPLINQLFDGKGEAHSVYNIDAKKDRDTSIFFNKITEKLKIGCDSADVLREVALAFEESGDIKTAYIIMSKAEELRPNGPFISRKIKDYRIALFE